MEIRFLDPKIIHLDHKNIALLDPKIVNYKFQLVAILKSNMADRDVKCQVEMGTIGFLDPKNIHFDTKNNSMGLIEPEILALIDFRWRPF